MFQAKMLQFYSIASHLLTQVLSACVVAEQRWWFGHESAIECRGMTLLPPATRGSKRTGRSKARHSKTIDLSIPLKKEEEKDLLKEEQNIPPKRFKK